MSNNNQPIETKHFIEQRIEADLAANRCVQGVITRFPPEPNGYLHIGHAKAICLNFAMATQYQGRCYLRFDDTNPNKEELEYVRAIQQDVQWLGFTWDQLFHTSDYFEKLFQFAVQLIEQGHAYVCSLSGDDIREMRGTLTEPGQNSPYRKRSVEDNLKLFADMRAGKYQAGEHVLRAKIDMSSGNINLRDPIMYRILHQAHPHTGEQWCIYPMYDFAHCFSDAIEGITHSLCTLEFQDHRPLYDWFLAQCLPEPRPQQIEFSRLNVSHTLTSKRKLKQLVDEGVVTGWADPRMPTISGMRKRGFTARAIRDFCQSVGISKSDSIIDIGLLEECVRDDLNQHAHRAMCVLDPIKITIENIEPEQIIYLDAPIHPQKPEMGSRRLPFTRELYIERDDFMEVPVKKYRRLAPDKEVRLRNAYVIKCIEVIKDPKTDQVIELKCVADLATLGKNPSDRKVKGVIHWVSCLDNQVCQVIEIDRLFSHEQPAMAPDWTVLQSYLNPNSRLERSHCYLESGQVSVGDTFQFERQGYYIADHFDETLQQWCFNRVVALRNTW